MSNTDFEAMMSDEQTEYPTLPGSEDQKPVKIVFNEDGTTDEFPIDPDTDDQDDGADDLDADDGGPSVDELKQYSDANRGGRAGARINTLTYEREEARRQAQAAQTEVERLRRENQALTQERTNSATLNLQMADNMRSSMKASRERELEAAKATMTKAYEDGNGAAIADAQAEIARIQAELTQITTAEQTAKQYQARQPQQPQQAQQAQQPQQGQQPQQQNEPLPPETLKWLGDNGHWFGRPEYTAETSFAYGLHERLAKEHAPGSKGYWSAANKILKAKFPELDTGSNFGVKGKMTGGQGKQRANTSSRPNVAAPANRTSGRDPRTKATTVTLTPSQAAIARKLGLNPTQYAAQLQKKDYGL